MTSLVRVSLGTHHAFLTPARGENPPILAVHGAFGHPEQLTPLAIPLAARGFTTYALALRGHLERSPDAVRGLSVSDYVRDVADAIQHLPATPILLGHSMGGLICEKVAETTRVAGLVLAAAAPAAALMTTSKALPTLLGMMPRIFRGLPLEPPRSAIERLGFVSSDATARRAVAKDLVPESGRAMRDMVLGAVKVDRARIDCPTLSFFGNRDYLVPPWQMRGEARRLGAKVIEYDGAGHFLVEEPWIERIADDIAAWIQTAVTTPRRSQPALTA